MTITLQRFRKEDKVTLGVLFIDGLAFYTLEDKIRDKKVKHETCIWEGCYEIKFREELTPLTKRYRKKFDWFTWHLEITDVPEFTGIYIHILNRHKESSGCPGIGTAYTIGKESTIQNSTIAYEKFYKIMSEKLKTDRVFIHIKNNIL